MDAEKQFLSAYQNESLGITNQKPKYSQYAVASKRRESFKTWPEYLPLEPRKLIDAGLVYTGVGDSVRCFYCGGGLRNWERGDNPWYEHAKWYPHCPYVQLVKGQNYIDRVKNGEYPVEIDGHILTEKEASAADPINSPAAQSCIENGFSEEIVKKAIAEYARKHNSIHFRGIDLCEIIYKLEEEIDGQDESDTVILTDAVKTETTETEENIDELFEENRQLKESKLCKICLDETSSIIFLPCGHMLSCPQCAPALVKCPLCRSNIKGFIKAYFATA